jgi:hypothetical protein
MATSLLILLVLKYMAIMSWSKALEMESHKSYNPSERQNLKTETLYISSKRRSCELCCSINSKEQIDEIESL